MLNYCILNWNYKVSFSVVERKEKKFVLVSKICLIIIGGARTGRIWVSS
jgi:hypothetical protein